jgi:hypothetical protein
MPTWVLVDAEDRMDIVGTPWASDVQKHFFVKKMREKMRKDKIQAYSLVTEAWAAIAPRGWEPGEPIVPPSERVDREEVVIVCASDGRETEWRQWTIRRDATERVVALEPRESGSGSFGGWMSELLK